jgi:N-acetylglucosaminyl-diphospho-decaprenol L-rhamnosyltransferase
MTLNLMDLTENITQLGGVKTNLINFSIINHAQPLLVEKALAALVLSPTSEVLGLRVWLTINLPDPSLVRNLQQTKWPFDLRIIQNPKPLGFGANHNQAFAHAQALGGGKWFCVMNPDVLWPADTDAFWAALHNDGFEPNVGLLCPMQVDEHGIEQDFARHVPTPRALAARVLRRMRGGARLAQPLSVNQADWVNGACMVWRSSAFAALGGFDERYFMYCEDTDICLRLQLAGYRMEQGPATVAHLAQRNTGKSGQHLAWHVRSLLRLWLSAAFWRYMWRFKIAPKFKSKN